MARSMKQQLTYVVRNNSAFGQSKHSDKGKGKSGVRHDGRSYSYATFNARLDTAKQFGGWITQNHPDLEMANKLTKDHINNFLAEKAETCTNDTLKSYASNLRALVKEVESTYKCELEIKSRDIITPFVERDPVRTIPFNEKDFEDLRKTYEKDSTGDKALALEKATGARAEELVTIRKEDIIIEKDRAIVHISNGKGGRERDVIVKDAASTRKLIDIRNITRDGERICPIKVDSLHKSLERHMKAMGIKEYYKDTSVHAMRKMWAQEEYDRCRREGMSKLETIKYVNIQLGHGAERDVALLGRYVHNIH